MPAATHSCHATSSYGSISACTVAKRFSLPGGGYSFRCVLYAWHAALL
ncbi:hypothetical protein RIEGSTA812A_PEG_856 [invertebrate metagenome]|uniref:Uncharacterized protein n=1 Tax=invertebrate metagenome TaxID=1711999 RepID=A0A484H978_9ZZZZ